MNPEREVLALLVEGGFNYAEIGELLGVGWADVAALAAAGRWRLTMAAALPDTCRAQLPRLAAILDGELVDVVRCPGCVRALATLRAIDDAYRAWRPQRVNPTETLLSSFWSK